MDTTLASLMVELDGTAAPLNRVIDNAVGMAQRGGNRAGSVFAAGFSSPILNAISSVNSLLGGIQTGVQFAVGVTGMSSAAQLGDYRRMLTGIAKDANKAETAFKAFQKIAGDSNFNTDQVFEFGLARAGKTGDVVGAARDTQNLLDASTVFGVSNGRFGQYQNNITEIGNRGERKIEIPDLQQLKNAAPLLSTKIADALKISIADANRKIDSATGNQLMQMIRAVGDANRGAAAKAGAADPFKVAANIGDDAGNAMASTGDLLNKAITPILQNVRGLVGGFGRLNDATGGGAGLAGVLALGTFAVIRLGGGIRSATMTVNTLTDAIRNLAGVSGSAAMTMNRSAAGGAVGGPSAGGWKNNLRTYGPGAAGAATTAVGMAVEKRNPALSEWLIGAGTGMMTGAGIGGAFGPWGALIGGGIGAFIGILGPLGKVLDNKFGEGTSNRAGSTALKTIIGPWGFIPGVSKAIDGMTGADQYNKKPGDVADSLKDAAHSLKGAAQSLETMKTTSLGGGPRSRYAVSLIENEYALTRLMGIKV